MAAATDTLAALLNQSAQLQASKNYQQVIQLAETAELQVATETAPHTATASGNTKTNRNKLQATAPQTPPPPCGLNICYALLIVSHLLTNNTAAAKMTWLRVLEQHTSINTDKTLLALWTITNAIIDNQAHQVYALARKHAWPNTIAPFVSDLVQKTKQQQEHVIAMGYSDIAPERVAHMLGLDSPADAINHALQRGWSVHKQGKRICPVHSTTIPTPQGNNHNANKAPPHAHAASRVAGGGAAAAAALAAAHLSAAHTAEQRMKAQEGAVRIEQLKNLTEYTLSLEQKYADTIKVLQGSKEASGKTQAGTPAAAAALGAEMRLLEDAGVPRHELMFQELAGAGLARRTRGMIRHG